MDMIGSGEAARVLGMTPEGVRAMVRGGALRVSHIVARDRTRGHRALVFERSEVERVRREREGGR